MSEMDRIRRETDAELARVRREADAAAEGLTGDAAGRAQIRAALEHTIKDLPRDIARLERALGIEIEPGSFLIAGQVFGSLTLGVDLVDAANRKPWVRELLVEYAEKVRA